jgi:hypothetical protein
VVLGAGGCEYPKLDVDECGDNELDEAKLDNGLMTLVLAAVVFDEV